MCLATVVNINQPDSIVLQYVSKIEVNGNTDRCHGRTEDRRRNHCHGRSDRWKS